MNGGVLPTFGGRPLRRDVVVIQGGTVRVILVVLGVFAMFALALWALLWWPLSLVEWCFVTLAGVGLVWVTAGLIWERPRRH
ncbi:hypothetical protein ACWGSK_06345 [Nocardiopsis sp. NPDC055551]|uniref:hypothetical protein n=1 Tax=Nocardiopsis sp. NPDC006832 TaxID=3157188 RepID=UPI0033D8ACBA